MADLMTRDELHALPLVVPLWPTVGRIFGLGRTQVYDHARRGALPVPVMKIGNTYRVAKADLLRAVGETEQDGARTA